MLLLHTPILWAIGCIVVLVVGALSGLVVLDAGKDRVLHDTYIVVTHLHSVLVLAVVFGFFAVWYALFPRITGYGYSRLLGNIHFWLSFIGVGVMLAPQIFIVPAIGERAADAHDMIRLGNFVASVGSAVSAAGLLVFLANMAISVLRRRPPD